MIQDWNDLRSLFTEIMKKRHVILREHAERMPEFRDALLKKAEEAEKGVLNINTTREDVEEALKKVDATLQEVEDQLSLHLPGAEACCWDGCRWIDACAVLQLLVGMYVLLFLFA